MTRKQISDHCATSSLVSDVGATPTGDGGADGGRSGQLAPSTLSAEEWLRANDPDYETVSRQGWTDDEGQKHGGWRQLRRGGGAYRIPREKETLQGLARREGEDARFLTDAQHGAGWTAGALVVAGTVKKVTGFIPGNKPKDK
jgi:hypothetical protein